MAQGDVTCGTTSPHVNIYDSIDVKCYNISLEVSVTYSVVHT